MILHSKKSAKYLDNPHYINVPRKSIIETAAVHLFLMNIGMVLTYYYFAPAGGLIVSWEIYYMISFVRTIWKKSGYSEAVFFIIMGVSLIADFFLSFLERRLIAQLFDTVISILGGY